MYNSITTTKPTKCAPTLSNMTSGIGYPAGKLNIFAGTGTSHFAFGRAINLATRKGYKMIYVTPTEMIPSSRLPKSSPHGVYGVGAGNHTVRFIGKYMEFKIGKWTAEELHDIKEYGHMFTAKQLMKNLMPERWHKDISRKRKELGITVNEDVRYKNLWTYEEMDMLKEYKDAPFNVLYDIFPTRTRNAIKNKMTRMGL